MSNFRKNLSVVKTQFFKKSYVVILAVIVAVTILLIHFTINETRDRIIQHQLSSPSGNGPVSAGYLVYFSESPMFSFMGLKKDLAKKIAIISSGGELEIVAASDGSSILMDSAIPLRLSSVILLLCTLGTLFYGVLVVPRLRRFNQKIIDPKGERILSLVVLDGALHIFVALLAVSVTTGFILFIRGAGPDFSRLYLYAAYFTTVFILLLSFYLLGAGISLHLRKKSATPGPDEDTAVPGFNYAIAVCCWTLSVIVAPALLNTYLTRQTAPIDTAGAAESKHTPTTTGLNNALVSTHGVNAHRAPNYGEPTHGPAVDNRHNRGPEFLGRAGRGPDEKTVALYLKEKAIQDKVNRIYLLSPITFFLLTVDEVSGLGQTSYLEFIAVALSEQDRVTRYAASGAPREAADTSAPVQTIHIFKAQSGLPVNFFGGLIINLFILLLMRLFLSLSCNVHHYRRSEKNISTSKVTYDIQPGSLTTFRAPDNDFLYRLLSVFDGRNIRHFTGDVTLNGKKPPRFGLPVCLLENHASLPDDMTVTEYIEFYSTKFHCKLIHYRTQLRNRFDIMHDDKLGVLEAHDKAAVMLSLAESIEGEVIFIGDFLKGLPESFMEIFQSSLDAMLAGKNTVLFFPGLDSQLMSDMSRLYNVRTDKGGYLIKNQVLPAETES